jgi:DnaK suppressor protein
MQYGKMMSQGKKEYYRALLNRKLEGLLDEANRTVSGMTDLDDNFPDPTDRASLESDRNFTLRIRDRERKLIIKIKEALERLEAGTYGICEACGEEISDKRLEARPVTTLCIDCKKRQESDEKLRGV